MTRFSVPAAILAGLVCVLAFFASVRFAAAQTPTDPSEPPGDALASPLQEHHVYLPLAHLGSRSHAPPFEDEEDLLEPDLRITLPQVTSGIPVVLSKDNLRARIENRSSQPKVIELHLLIIVNGEELRAEYGPITIQSSFPMTYTFPGLIAFPDAPRSPAPFLLTAVELPSGPGGQEIHVSTEGSYYVHVDEGNSSRIVLYNELGLRAQTRNLTFVNAPEMSRRLQDTFGFLDTSNVLGIALYDYRDPDIVEPPIIPDPPAPTAAPADNNFILCPEWYVNLDDNNLGEDYGTVDDGWRARGAIVTVYVNGNTAYNGQLNQYGCVTIPTSGAPANIIIYFAGAASLRTDGNHSIFLLHYDTQASTTAANAAIGILNALPNVVYRPEVSGWDGFGVISYVIQERFNAGASGAVFLYSDDCPSDSSNCSTTFNGNQALFLRPNGQNGWKRKFIAAHEWGHKVLTLTTSGLSNDCSFQEPGTTSSHGMKSSEYTSCAAMEGWAHFVAAEAWNNPLEGSNPGGTFIYWSGTAYDVETGPDVAWCIHDSWLSGYNQPSLCNYYGVELDWFRQWWDFRTNNTASSPGFRPSHSYLKTIIDLTVFSGGEYNLSGAIQDQLSDPEMRQRWLNYGCVNGVHTFGCN